MSTAEQHLTILAKHLDFEHSGYWTSVLVEGSCLLL
ncbi:MAG: hypothetical protein CM15mP88_1620 [Pseudomonadota bacterium]|nr:MAG: hypothetical protein CM15mP88_1620 [Pseudomonadota bacterium]